MHRVTPRIQLTWSLSFHGDSVAPIVTSDTGRPRHVQPCKRGHGQGRQVDRTLGSAEVSEKVRESPTAHHDFESVLRRRHDALADQLRGVLLHQVACAPLVL